MDHATVSGGLLYYGNNRLLAKHKELYQQTIYVEIQESVTMKHINIQTERH